MDTKIKKIYKNVSYLRDIFMLPSEQVELAGLGGGGIEAESYSSFCLSFSRGSSGNLGLFGG